MNESGLEIKIIHAPDKNNPFAIIYKPSGLPSAPINNDDKNNAFYKAAEKFPELMDVVGRKECEHGLLHRIDTVTKGLLLIASSQDSYDFLINIQKQKIFKKYYKAVCKNIQNTPLLLGDFPPQNNLHLLLDKKDAVTVESFFRPFGPRQKEVRPVTNLSGPAALKKCGSKLYSTDISTLSKTSENITVECQILEGYRHQIRAHLAWIGFPIAGDDLYDPEPNGYEFSFEAYKMEFVHPLTKECVAFSS